MFRKTTCGVDGALKLGTLPERMRATEKSTKPRSLGLSDDDRRGRRGRRGAVKSVLSIRPAHPSIGPPLAAAVRPSGSGSPLWWREIHPSPALSSRPLATLAPPCYLLRYLRLSQRSNARSWCAVRVQSCSCVKDTWVFGISNGQ